MKICFIVGAFPNMKCGIGDYTFCLANQLVKQGNEVNIITSKNALNDFENIHVYNFVESWKFKNIKLIISKLQEIKPDVVIIQYPSGEYKKNLMINFLPFYIKRKIKCILMETIHEYTVFTILGRIRNSISFIKADDVVVVEEDYISAIRKLNKKVKIDYIPIAANTKQSKLNKSEMEDLKNKLQLEKEKIITFYGLANENKELENLLYVIKSIDNVKLLFIGEMKNTDEFQKKILDLIDKYEIKDRVHITGYAREEAADYLKISDVCVLPFKNGVSKRNGSFLAAYNQNIPIVTTSGYLKDGEGIFYAKMEDKEELLKKTLLALEYDKDSIQNREILKWEDVANRYIEVIERMKE